MNISYQVKFTYFAETDLEQLIFYISENDSKEKALKQYKKIKNKILDLLTLPQRGRIVPELKSINIKDYLEIVLAPYRIIYFIEEKTVYIAAIFDGRRDLEEIILDRLI